MKYVTARGENSQSNLGRKVNRNKPGFDAAAG